MRNLKGNNLRSILLAILVVAVFAPALVHAKDYTVGVKAGDWVKYGQITVTWTGNGTEPSYVTDEKKLDWVRIDVLSVAGTTASLNLTLHYNNGTQTFQSQNVDVQSGGSAGMEYLIASNLTLGDPLSLQTPEPTINQTVTGLYAGANRNVNMIDSINSYQGVQSESKIYWDQNTGIMVEIYFKQPDYNNPGAYTEVSIKATETNLWSANTLDLIQNNLIYIIAAIAVIIVIVAATIVLRRRKPPSSQQPPLPPPSAPPPTPS
ncbi:MAG: hypothetical protein ABSB28_08490 [Candidatus Bathyarchaeia archaeon]